LTDLDNDVIRIEKNDIEEEIKVKEKVEEPPVVNSRQSVAG